MEFLSQPNNPGRNAKPVAYRFDRKSNRIQDTTKKQCEKPPKTLTGFLGQGFDFIEMLGKLLGWKLSFNWKTNSRHRFTVIYLIFTWSQILYSQAKFFLSGEHKRILEVSALYGAALSVIQLKIKIGDNI